MQKPFDATSNLLALLAQGDELVLQGLAAPSALFSIGLQLLHLLVEGALLVLGAPENFRCLEKLFFELLKVIVGISHG